MKLWLLLMWTATLFGQDWPREVVGLARPAGPDRERMVLDDIELSAKNALRAIPRARTREEADRARTALRSRLEQALGFRKMPWPPRLQPRVTGTLRRDGYRIEKIVFQALPGVEVPAHLYLPENLTGRTPAVLFYNGHWWAESKTLGDHQMFCANMAKLGFVVLSFDPFGQGERGVSARDHRRVEALPAGVSQQGFAEYETQCALSYLLSRKEVDPQRIGLTGASGGGYNTWITAALDDRIKVAVPVVGTSDFYLQIAFTRGNDWYRAAEHCHFIPGLITFADNHELLAMAAPRPTLIINSTTDAGFPIGDVFDYGKELYRSYGVADRISFFHDPTAGHGYQQKKREAAYGWFLRWLAGRGDGSPVAEMVLDVPPWDATELRSLPAKSPSGPAMVAFAAKLARETTARVPRPPAEFFGRPVPVADVAQIESRPVQRLEFAIGGIRVPAILLRTAREKGLLIAVDDRGKEALAEDPVVRRALDAGWSVCGIDPRGIGELTVSLRGWAAAVGLLAGDNFVWRQAGELVSIASSLQRNTAFAGKPMHLYARGDNAVLAATYAIGHTAHAGPQFAAYILRNGFLSYRQFLDRPKSLAASYRLLEGDRREERISAFDREIPFWYVPFDVLRAFDLPQLLAASSAKGYIVDPIDGDWQTMSPASARRLLPASIVVSDVNGLPGW